MGTVNAGTNATAAQYNDAVLAQNYIMNGNFNIWQRGTTDTIASATITYVADRWIEYAFADGGTLPTITVSRQLLTSGELEKSFYFHRYNVDGAGSSLGADSEGHTQQRIEYGTRLLAGASRKITVSFYARSSISSKKLGIYLRQNYGTGGSPSSQENIVGTTWVLSSSWTKYTHTFELNTLSGKTFGTDNNDYISLLFMYAWNTSYDSFVGESSNEDFGGAGNIDIAQVQFNIGETALEFKPLAIDAELLQCKRYYEHNYAKDVSPSTATGVNGFYYMGTINGTQWHYERFEVQKRSDPTVTFYSTNGTAGNITRVFTGDVAVTLEATYTNDKGLLFSHTAVDGAAYHGFYTAESEI